MVYQTLLWSVSRGAAFPWLTVWHLELGQMEAMTVPVASLDINLYRDDLQERAQPLVRPTQMPFPVDGKKIVLVDDVLFHRSHYPSCSWMHLMDFGRPGQVQSGDTG